MSVAGDSIQLKSSMSFQVHGFSEAVFIVNDLAASKRFYIDFIGWHVIAEDLNEQSHANTSLVISWQLGSNVKAKQVLLAEPNVDGGFIRLVSLANTAQCYIRPNNQIWDTGGIFDVNTRVTDIFNLAQQMHKQGWFGVNDPVPMQFGPFKVFEWLAKGHDGATFACIERIEPPLENSQQTTLFSAIFNSSMIVVDHQLEVDFYQKVLGFESLVEQKACFDSAKSNVFGMPHNWVNKSPHHLSMLGPASRKGGSVEIVSFPDMTGSDVSDRANPPNIGIATLRFLVDGLDAFICHCKSLNVTIVNESVMTIPHYGSCKLVVLTSPQGTWLEFYQPLS